MNGVIQWNIGHKTVWTVDLAHGNGNVFKGQAEKPDVIFVLSEDHFLQLSSGKLKPQQASNFGLSIVIKLRVSGFDLWENESSRQHEICNESRAVNRSFAGQS